MGKSTDRRTHRTTARISSAPIMLASGSPAAAEQQKLLTHTKSNFHFAASNAERPSYTPAPVLECPVNNGAAWSALGAAVADPFLVTDLPLFNFVIFMSSFAISFRRN